MLRLILQALSTTVEQWWLVGSMEMGKKLTTVCADNYYLYFIYTSEIKFQNKYNCKFALVFQSIWNKCIIYWGGSFNMKY